MANGTAFLIRCRLGEDTTQFDFTSMCGLPRSVPARPSNSERTLGNCAPSISRGNTPSRLRPTPGRTGSVLDGSSDKDNKRCRRLPDPSWSGSVHGEFRGIALADRSRRGPRAHAMPAGHTTTVAQLFPRRDASSLVPASRWPPDRPCLSMCQSPKTICMIRPASWATSCWIASAFFPVRSRCRRPAAAFWARDSDSRVCHLAYYYA